MMPIFSCGRVTVASPRRTAPCVGVSSPEMARSNVDFPQPEPPIAATISPGETPSVMASSACTPFGYVLPTRSRLSMSALARAAEAVFPAQERRRGDHDQPVGQLADNGEGDNGGDDLRRLAELLAVDQQISQAFR